MKLMEKVVDDLVTYLTAGMPAKLDALEAEYADSITLDDIKTYYIAEQKSIPEYPSLMVLGDATQPSDQGDAWLKARHAITLICLVEDQDETTLKRKLYRYARAVAELTLALRQTWQQRVEINTINYAPIYGNEGLFLSDVSLKITVPKVEGS